MTETEHEFWIEQWQWIRERAAYLRAQQKAASGECLATGPETADETPTKKARFYDEFSTN